MFVCVCVDHHINTPRGIWTLIVMLSSYHGARTILFYHKVNAMRIPCGVYILEQKTKHFRGGRVAVVEVGVKHDNLNIDTHIHRERYGGVGEMGCMSKKGKHMVREIELTLNFALNETT